MCFTFIQSWEKAFRLKINESLHHKVSLDPFTPIGLVLSTVLKRKQIKDAIRKMFTKLRLFSE